jgi:lambda repressor-like predicted transcriptional regulator
VNKRETEQSERRAERGLPGRHGREWTKAEELTLKEFYATESPEFICSRLPGRKWSAITSHAWEIGLRRNHYLTKHLRKKRDTKIEVIRALIAAREKKGWTMVDLARKSGYAYVTIVQLENMNRLPRSRTLIDWCDALDMELTVREKRTV